MSKAVGKPAVRDAISLRLARIITLTGLAPAGVFCCWQLPAL
jgi:hypothetical protein